MSYLEHYGIKGQKWGVRRFQNPDGTLTEVGKDQARAKRRAKTKPDVDEIMRTMSQKERDFLGLAKEDPINHPNDPGYLDIEGGEYAVKRCLIRDGKIPVANLDILRDGDQGVVAIGTRSGDQYRGKGYAQKAVKQGMAWFDKHGEEYGMKVLTWGARADNVPSNNLAKKSGFEFERQDHYDDFDWNVWRHYANK